MSTSNLLGLLACTSLLACEQVSGLGMDTEMPGSRATTVEAPSEGRVAVGSVGYVRLVPDVGDPVDALHVRTVISGLDRVVTGDGTVAQLTTPGGIVRPIAVNANAPGSPIVIAERGAREIVDLYFPPVGGPGTTLAFAWTVSTPRGPYAIHADVQPGMDGGWGPALSLGGAKHWWFAATYDWSAYRHDDGVITTQPPHSAKVRTDDREPREVECNDW
jgi:hypothetical protein